MTQHQHPGHVDTVLADGDEPMSNPSANGYFGDILEQTKTSRPSNTGGSGPK